MTDRPDPLALATRALKARYDADAEAPAPPSTRERVLERATADVRQRRVSRLVFLPLAAAFVLFATWAAATGALQRIFQPEVDEQRGHALASNAPPERSAPAATAQPPLLAASTAAPTPEPAPSASVALATPPVASAPAPATIPSGAQAPARPSATGVASAAPPAVTAPDPTPAATAAATGSVPSPEDELYATARRAHFDDRDYGRALAAWDRYLAAAPSGRLAPEARYNRAICLARLGRKDEARAALEPFASGSMGGYRKLEAQKLLDAL